MSRGSEDLILASAFELNDQSILPSRQRMNQLKEQKWAPQILLYPILSLKENETVSNVSGAGDCASSGIIAGIIKSYTLHACIYNGLAAAKLSLMSDRTVSEKLNGLNLDYIQKLVEENQINIKKILL